MQQYIYRIHLSNFDIVIGTIKDGSNIVKLCETLLQKPSCEKSSSCLFPPWILMSFQRKIYEMNNTEIRFSYLTIRKVSKYKRFG